MTSTRPRWCDVGPPAMLLSAGVAVLIPLGADALHPVTAAAADVYVAVVVDFGGAPGAPANVVKCAKVPAGSTDAQALAAVTTPGPAFANTGLLCAIETFPQDGVSNCKASSGKDYYFWSYWHGSTGTWKYADNGPAEVVVAPGDVEGWRYQDPGPASPAAPAPATSPDYAAICPQAADAPTSSTTTPDTTTTAAAPQGATRNDGAPSTPTNPVSGRRATPDATTAPSGSGSHDSGTNNASGTGASHDGSTTTTSSPSGGGSAPTTSSPPRGRTGEGARPRTTKSANPTVRRSALAASRSRPKGATPWPLAVAGAIVLILGAASLVRWRRRKTT